MEDITELLRLLWGTVIHRPYVYGFFACFLVFALHHLGLRRMLVFLVSTFLIAFGSEYSATRNGFPFGIYTYIDETRTRELWISNVPFWDSLSFVFLSYFSLIVAAAALGRLDLGFARARAGGVGRGLLGWLQVPALGGLLMMLLDVVIDPVTLLGDRWFLGRVYFYPNGGPYFGVTLENFAGWFFVGFVTQVLFLGLLDRWKWLSRGAWRALHPRFASGAFGVYAGVFAFNLGVTFWVGEYRLFAASSLVAGLALLGVFLAMKTRGAFCALPSSSTIEVSSCVS